MSRGSDVPRPAWDEQPIGSRSPGSRSGLRAFTILEAMISTIIVAVMLVAALNTVGASRLTQQKASLSVRGRLMAESLLAEILRQSYADPDGTPVFGRESNEAVTPRTAWDDVDDYAGFSESPPAARDGTILSNSTGWERKVTVAWVDAADPAVVAAGETNLKRVTVTVAYGGVPQASLVALKANVR